MKNSFNLNSPEWCDIIFANKNKDYGAFSLRQTSGKRHLIAFAFIVLFMGFVTVLPKILETVKASTSAYLGEMNQAYTMVKVDNEKIEQPEELIPKVPEPPKFRAMDKFVPPVIAPDTQVKEEHVMKSMESLNNSNKIIGGFEVEKGSTDPDAIRKEIEYNNLITGNGNNEANTVNKVFERVEIMPQFPGGDAELQLYIGKNVQYPAVDLETGTHGLVVIRFVVDKEGYIKDPVLLRGISPGCDKEALRVIKSMPRWIPGKQNGEPVQVYFTLPVLFRIGQK